MVTNQFIYKVISPKRSVGNGELVSNLIDHDLRLWKTQPIRDTLLPHEADEILSIPFSSTTLPNSLVWTITSNGSFSIHSAYKIV